MREFDNLVHTDTVFLVIQIAIIIAPISNACTFTVRMLHWIIKN